MQTAWSKKATAIIIALATLVLYFVDINRYIYCLRVSAPIEARLLYPFLHVSLLHVLLNIYCFILLVFRYSCSISSMVLGYITCALCPEWLLTDTPTLGLSGMYFFLLGRITLGAHWSKSTYVWLVAMLLLGFVVPSTNGSIHLYAYVVGLAIGWLVTPNILCRPR